MEFLIFNLFKKKYVPQGSKVPDSRILFLSFFTLFWFILHDTPFEQVSDPFT